MEKMKKEEVLNLVNSIMRNSTVLINENQFPKFKKMKDGDAFSYEDLHNSIKFYWMQFVDSVHLFSKNESMHIKEERKDYWLNEMREFFKEEWGV